MINDYPRIQFQGIHLVRNDEVNISIAARAPKYEPPIPITTNTSELDFIRFDASTILENSFLS